MLSKKFYIQIVIRIILILITTLSFIPFISNEDKLFSIISLLFILIIQIVLLIQYINKFNRNIYDFFTSLKTNDASFAFHDKIFPHISNTFRENIDYVRNQLFEVTRSKEIQQSYFKSVIENAQTGIISINSLNKVDIINKKAKEILKISHLKDLSDIKEKHSQFYKYINSSKAGFEDLVSISTKSEQIPLSIRVSEFKQKNEHYKLISFHNIQSELDINEIDSWHKLIRILTHEINNTISPIASLASSLHNLYYDNDKKLTRKDVNDEIINKTTDGLQIINERGIGLIDFVKNYRRISLLNEINRENIKVAELFYNTELLFKEKLNKKGIHTNISIKPFDLEINADKKYLEQIIINLIKNAIEAIQNKNGKIDLSAFRNEKEKTILVITDNGTGISNNILEQIFIPFFTTKEQGSGIGLSLARQIMRLHGGSISVRSIPNNETAFTLSF